MKKKLFFIFVSFMFVFLPYKVSATQLSITGINCITDGDAVLLESKSNNLLMDTCTTSSKNAVINYLLNKNITNLDIYLSHYHMDHFGEILEILNNNSFKVGKLYLPYIDYIAKYNITTTYNAYDHYNNIYNKAVEKGVEVIFLKNGSSFSVGDARVEIIGPIGKYTLEQFLDVDISKATSAMINTAYNHYINNNSLVARITVGNIVYLSAGDIEKEEEQNLLNAGINISANIMKMSHHAGSTSNIEAFLQKINPQFSFYSYYQDINFGQHGFVRTNVQNMQKIANLFSIKYNGNIKYIINNDDISTYSEVNYQKINIKYVDIDTKNIIQSKEYLFAKDSTYHLFDINKSISNYNYVSTEGSLTGSLAKDEIITLYYKKNSKKITIKYVDEENKILSDQKIIDLQMDSKYDLNSSIMNIDGYIYNNSSYPLSGTVKENVTIYLYYKKDIKKFIINYVDPEKNILHEQKTVDLQKSKQYNLNSSIINIDGYIYNNSSYPLSGTVKENVTIYLYYKKDNKRLTLNYVDHENKVLHKPKIIDLQMNTQYDLNDSIISIKGYKYTDSSSSPLVGTVSKDLEIYLYYRVSSYSDESVKIVFNTVLVVIFALIIIILIGKTFNRLKNRQQNEKNY